MPKAQNGVGDPAILVDDVTGAIWVIAAWTHGMGNGRAWVNSMDGNGKETTAQLMLAKSTDDGRTWSAPINITGQVKDPSWNFLLQGPGMGITMARWYAGFPHPVYRRGSVYHTPVLCIARTVGELDHP